LEPRQVFHLSSKKRAGGEIFCPARRLEKPHANFYACADRRQSQEFLFPNRAGLQSELQSARDGFLCFLGGRSNASAAEAIERNAKTNRKRPPVLLFEKSVSGRGNRITQQKRILYQDRCRPGVALEKNLACLSSFPLRDRMP